MKKFWKLSPICPGTSNKISDQELPVIQSKKEEFMFLGWKLFPAILGLIGAGLIILATDRFNAGASPDSVLYLSTARNIANGKGITSMFGPMVDGMPLYPLLLGFLGYIFHSDPLILARFVNALLFGLIVYLSGILFKRHLKSLTLVYLGTVSVLISFALVDVSLWMWTEPLFIYFVLLFLFFSEIYIDKRNMTSLMMAAFSISLATLTRKISFPVIFIGILYILLFNKDRLITKFRHLFVYIFISLLPVMVTLIRNYILSGFLFGANYSPVGKVSFKVALTNTYQLATRILDLIINWFIPETITSRYTLMLLCLILGIIIGLNYQKTWRKPTGLLLIFPVLLFIIGYIGTLLLIEGPYNYLDPRYVTPICIPVMLLYFIMAEKWLMPVLLRFNLKYGSLIFVGGMVIGLVYPALKTIQHLRDHMLEGKGYTGLAWETSGTIQYLIQHPQLDSECEIYSNGPDAIYLLTGMITETSPKTEARGGVTDISLLKDTWPEESKACLVWFDNIVTWEKNLFSPEELMTIVNLEEVLQFQDGAIYVYSRK